MYEYPNDLPHLSDPRNLPDAGSQVQTRDGTIHTVVGFYHWKEFQDRAFTSFFDTDSETTHFVVWDRDPINRVWWCNKVLYLTLTDLLCMETANMGFKFKEVAECEYCTSHIGKMHPSHRGSTRCQSGSLASGGTRSHCTCDTCF